MKIFISIKSNVRPLILDENYYLYNYKSTTTKYYSRFFEIKDNDHFRIYIQDIGFLDKDFSNEIGFVADVLKKSYDVSIIDKIYIKFSEESYFRLCLETINRAIEINSNEIFLINK